MSTYRSPTLVLDLDASHIERDGERIRLTTLEARVVRYLAERMDQPVMMDALLRDVWGYRDGVVTKAVYESMRRLRRKLERDPDNPLHLLTEWGAGYRLRGLTVCAPDTVIEDELYGRDALLDIIEQKLASARLVTLTGPGGAGKTTLAQRFARGEGALWCDLEACRTAADLVGAVAGLLGLQGGGEPDAGVVAALRARGDTLLVLDNFEQIVDDAPVVARWLQRCPALRVLTTSRRALHVRDEQIVLVPPLGAPATPSADHPAVALLLRRIAAVAPEHVIGEAEVRAATRIVQAVDGLPLALEIVAARARLGTLADLARRVETSIFDLPSARRDLPARQLSLDATLTWSWLLLSDQARQCLAQVVVFEGAVTLEAAERVVELSGSVPLALDELVDANLLQPRNGRLQPFVGVRELVRAKEGTGPLAPVVRGPALARLWRWALTLPEDRRSSELENLRGALRTAQADADVRSVAQLAVVWTQTLMACRPLAMALAELNVFLRRADFPEEERLELLLLATNIHQLGGDVSAARAVLVDAMPVAERLGLTSIGRVRLWEGVLLHDEKDLAAAEASYREALATLDKDRMPLDTCRAYMTLGFALMEAGRFDEARASLGEALERAHAIGGASSVAPVLQALGLLEHTRGRPGAAVGWLEQALELANRAQSETGAHLVRANLGLALLALGEAERARELLEPAVLALRQMGRRRHLALTLLYLGQAEYGCGERDRALERFVEVIELTRSTVVPEGEGGARAWRGRILLERGDRAGVDEILRGVALLRGAGDDAEAARAEAWIPS